jgi:hypothetical protein
MLTRINAVRRPGEDRLSLIRAAIEQELQRREATSDGDGTDT